MARSRSRSLTALGAATLLAPLSLLLPAARADMVGEGPAPSTWVGTATLSPTPEHRTDSDGDLWPTCWSADGDLYSAWGDGHGFGGEDFVDIGTARITGDSPDALSGENLATGDAVVPHPWTANHSRKPTGMMCEGSTLYLAVQDLAFDFNDAPAATIVKSTDGGRTWAAKDTAKPMFSDEEFTTIWFADFGKGGEWNDSKYAYAYATDHNWRGQGDVYLARVPKDRVDDRGAWEFYTGSSKKGDATFSKKIEQKVPVLSDHRLNYNNTFIDTVPSTEGGIISQGGTLYNKALDRYILSSWSWGTQHFYESPTPWGPWTEASYHDMTRAAEQDVEIWGYGISLLSKFMSEDGRSMQMQSNQCCGLPNANPNYNFNLRTYTLTPLDDQVHDDPTGEDLATLEDAVPISKPAPTSAAGTSTPPGSRCARTVSGRPSPARPSPPPSTRSPADRPPTPSTTSPPRRPACGSWATPAVSTATRRWPSSAPRSSRAGCSTAASRPPATSSTARGASTAPPPAASTPTAARTPAQRTPGCARPRISAASSSPSGSPSRPARPTRWAPRCAPPRA